MSPSPPTLSTLEYASTRMSDTAVHSISGASGGLASGIVTCPLDVIKTKLQAQGGFRQSGSSANLVAYRGMVGTARVILHQEGLRGLYRGLGPTVLGYLPTWAVWFAVYDKSKLYFASQNDPHRPWISHLLSSLVAGGCSTMATNPIWVIKTRLMSQVALHSSNYNARPSWRYKSTLDAARIMYHTEGIRSFYSGLSPALLGLTHVAVQFPLYEYFKLRFTGLLMGEQTEGSRKPHWLGVLSASVLSKICASSATYPHEVIRTRLQTQQRSFPTPGFYEGISFRGVIHNRQQSFGAPSLKSSYSNVSSNQIPRYRGLIKTFKTILAEEGWRAFYSGMGTNMMRAVPAAATTLLTYEFTMSSIRELQTEGARKLACADF